MSDQACGPHSAYVRARPVWKNFARGTVDWLRRAYLARPDGLAHTARRSISTGRSLLSQSVTGRRRGPVNLRHDNANLEVIEMKRALLVPTVATLLALCWSATSALAAVSSENAHPGLAGTWSGHYGGAYSGTFTVHWTQSGSSLTGSITLSKPAGNYGINGRVHGNAITFGAVGAGATYTGSVSGKSMSGSYKTAQGGGTWSAHKTA
jgi:hypothetical protein